MAGRRKYDRRREGGREKDELYRQREEGRERERERGIESRCKHDQSAPN